MGLEVIGAGFGRTGTESMKLALEALGFGPCHHMKEVLADPARVALWRAIARGDAPDWDAAFAGFRSTVDWPSAYYWRELSAHYPAARVVLTVRDAESWHASMEKTIFRHIGGDSDPDSVGVRLIREQVFGGDIDDRAHVIAAYEKNIADVQAALPADRLLTFRLGDGWEPLCRFLGRPVPDTPFPRVNAAETFDTVMAAAGNRTP